jgi:hypothetical protein
MDRAERGSHGQAAGDDTERVRKTVSSRIRDTIGRIRRQQPELADHLEATVSTGIWCCYQLALGRVQRPPDSNQRLSVDQLERARSEEPGR